MKQGKFVEIARIKLSPTRELDFQDFDVFVSLYFILLQILKIELSPTPELDSGPN